MSIKFDHEAFRKDIRTKRLVEDELPTKSIFKKIGVSRATLYRCENGGVPDLITYAKLCQWLGISLDKHIKRVK